MSRREYGQTTTHQVQEVRVREGPNPTHPHLAVACAQRVRERPNHSPPPGCVRLQLLLLLQLLLPVGPPV